MSKRREQNNIDSSVLPEEFGAYRFVVDHVLENVKKDFEQEGVDGSILSDLQSRWETKLMSSGALSLEPTGSQKENTAGPQIKRAKQDDPEADDQEQRAQSKQGAEADLKEKGSDDEEDLENLDSQLDDDDPDTGSNLVLAYSQKVNRTKSRWRCTLKSGIMNIGGRDKLFKSANGDFNF